MPQYRVKDLMINLQPDDRLELLACPLHTICWKIYSGCHLFISHCNYPTIIACYKWLSDCGFVSPGCGYFSDPCGAISPVCGLSIDPTITIRTIIEDPRILPELRQQLQRQLRMVEVTERAMEEAMVPQTAEEMDELMGKLRDAMADLEKRRGEMGKKG
jgi:hypothetical protein